MSGVKSLEIKRNSMKYCVLIVSYLILGIIFVNVYSKIQSLNDLEANIDKRLKKVEIMEERLGKLHESVVRQRRETNQNNQTTEDVQSARNQNSRGERQSGACIGGATYTRWGRKICSNESELIYEGVVGGSHFTHTGGAVNHLCLPRVPTWDNYQDGLQEYAFLFGTEYERKSDSLFSLTNVRNLHNGNVPCAVCRSRKHQSVIMIPARNICYSGWTLEYHGYLMAGHHTHKKGSMYICVDKSPEVAESGYRDEDGNLLYSVEARCGSLPCPEYIDGREITCAVCSK